MEDSAANDNNNSDTNSRKLCFDRQRSLLKKEKAIQATQAMLKTLVLHASKNGKQ